MTSSMFLEVPKSKLWSQEQKIFLQLSRRKLESQKETFRNHYSHIDSWCRNNNDCLCNFQSSFSFGVIQRVQIHCACDVLSFICVQISIVQFCFCFMCRKLENINNNSAAFAFRRHCMMMLYSISLTHSLTRSLKFFFRKGKRQEVSFPRII